MMTQSTKRKAKKIDSPKGSANKKLNRPSKKRITLKSSTANPNPQDFTIDDLHKEQKQNLSKQRYEKELKKLSVVL